jgi:hypothetical protein
VSNLRTDVCLASYGTYVVWGQEEEKTMTCGPSFARLSNSAQRDDHRP